MRLLIVLIAEAVSASALAFDTVMPRVELLVRVSDTTHAPVSAAETGVFFPHIYPVGAAAKGEGKRVLTDKKGVAVLTARTASQVCGGVGKEGHYHSTFKPVDFMQMEAEGKPLKAEREIVLKRIMHPVPMIARQLPEFVIPKENEPCGFDLELGDWVPPRGKGRHADLVINIAGSYPSCNEFDATLEITFPNPADGLIWFEGSANTGSELVSDYLAPETGYVPALSLSKRAKAGETTRHWIDESKPDSNYYFRVRTVLDERGGLVSAHYGKIYGGFEFGRYMRSETLFLKSGVCYFNPTPKERNVEFDRSRNLAKDVTPSNAVTLP